MGTHEHGSNVPGVVTILRDLIAVIALIVGVEATVGFLAAFTHGTQTLAVVLCLLALLEGMLWVSAGRLRGRGQGRLQRSLMARMIALPTIALVATLVPMGKTSVIAISAVACTLGVTRVWLWYVTRRDKRRDGRRRARREQTRALLAEHGMEMPAAHEWPAAIAVSGVETFTAHLIAALLVLLAGLCIATDVDAALQDSWQPLPQRAAAVKPPPVKKKHHSTQKHEEEQKSSEPSGSEGASGNPPENKAVVKPCGPITNGPGVDGDSITRLEALLTLAGSDGESGCASAANVQDTSAGPMYWAVAHATAGGAATAIAVIAPQQRRFVALAPAVEPIEELIRRGVPIGAEREFGRVYAGEGLLYVILSDQGSTLLSKETLGAETLLVECPPAVATAIRSADKQLGWLWPSPPVRRHGELVYKLKTSVHARAREAVHYDPATGTAWRGPVHKPIPYTARQQNLVISELRTWIPEPPAAEIVLEAEIERDEAAGE